MEQIFLQFDELYTENPLFNDLIQSVQHCDLCPRLFCRSKILSIENGNIHSKVLFIAEAPGRLGANKTGIPLHGDRTGKNFELFLKNIGWNRDDIFITNAVLCNPQQENGNNATPTLEEIENCSAYLEMTISLVNPEVIVTLGQRALDALNIICRHSVTLSQDVASEVKWNGRVIFPLYHPSPRVHIHRSQSVQRSDYMKLQKYIHPGAGIKERKRTQPKPLKNSEIIQDVARAFLSLFPQQWVSQFRLTKLFYLFDLEAKRLLGSTYACPVYLRQEYGPWPPDLFNALSELGGHEIHITTNKKRVEYRINTSLCPDIQLPDEIMAIINGVYERYGTKNDSDLRKAVYLTSPMKYILKQEKRGNKMQNVPVLYKDKEAQETNEDA